MEPSERARPIRIMHVVDTLLLAGMEYGVIKIANQLPSSMEPSICCLRFQTEETRPVVSPHVRVVPLNERTRRNWGLIGKLADLFRRERIDVVHSHNWVTYFYAVPAARLAGVRAVIHGEHGHDEETPSARRLWIKRRLAPLVTQFVAVSENIACELRDEWRIPVDRIAWIPNGVDLTGFRPDLDGALLRAKLGLKPEHEVIVNVGVLRRVKDVPTLVRAFARVRAARPNARLLRVGGDADGSLREEVDGLADSLGVTDAIRNAGVRRDIPRLLAASDVYVNSSTYEGMSNTILEAMAMGKPVVATAVGGNVKLVREGETGFLVPSHDPVALAARIEALLADPARRKAIGTAGRAYVEENHGMSRMIDAYVDLYEEVFAQSRPRADRGAQPAPAGRS